MKAKDIYGREIKIGDYILYSNSGRGLSLHTCCVTGMTPKGQLQVDSNGWPNRIPKPELSCVIVSEKEIPEKVLKQIKFYHDFKAKHK